MEDLVERALLKNRIRNCTECELYKGCTKPVPLTVGALGGLAVIGEAPGRVENLVNRPFQGPSGRLLHRTLRGVGLKPHEISYFNVVSCWPNRADPAPKQAEIDACSGNLRSQVEYVRPDLVLVLGRVAFNATFNLRADWGEVRGYWYEWRYSDNQSTWCLSTYHPAAILRSQTLGLQFNRDVAFWSKQVPVENNWCLKRGCEDRATEYWNGVGWCAYHVPQYKRNPDAEQLELW